MESKNYIKACELIGDSRADISDVLNAVEGDAIDVLMINADTLKEVFEMLDKIAGHVDNLNDELKEALKCQ